MSDGTTGNPAAPSVGPAEQAVARAQLWSAATDTVRRRADVSAKAVGGLGLTAVTALGLTKFADVWPVEGDGTWAAGLLLGFVLMATAVLVTTKRLWDVNKPLIMMSNVALMADLDGDTAAQERVRRVYDDMARLNTAPTLQAYQARAFRYEAIAERLSDGDPRKQTQTEKADVVRADVRATHARAATEVVRQRATAAVGSPAALTWAVVFVLGLGLAGVSSDALEADRAATTRARACAEAAGVLRTQSVPLGRLSADCGFSAETTAAPAPATSTPPADVRQEDAASLRDLVDEYAACVATGGSAEACESVRRRIVSG